MNSNYVVILECKGDNPDIDLKHTFYILQDYKDTGYATTRSKLKFNGEELPTVAGLWGRGDYYCFMAANFRLINGEKKEFADKLPKDCDRGSILYALEEANIYLDKHFGPESCFSQKEIDKIASRYPEEAVEITNHPKR